MADTLHTIVSKFRDAVLTSTARLEFELRDYIQSIPPPFTSMNAKLDSVLDNLQSVLDKLQSVATGVSNMEILNIQSSQNSKNIVVKSMNTPALSSLVATFNPPSMELEESMEKDSICSSDIEEGGVEDEEEEEKEEEIEVEEFEFKGILYQKDNNQNIYMDGELIGTWDGKKIIGV